MSHQSRSRSLALDVLKLARKRMRTDFPRSSDYYQKGDIHSEMFLGTPFGMESNYYLALGTDYSAIDWLYEALGEGGKRQLRMFERPSVGVEDRLDLLGRVTRQLQEMTNLEHASRELEPLAAHLQQPCSELDVCRALLASITVLGNEALRDRGLPHLAREWLALWGSFIEQQNSQQELHTRLCLLMQVSSDPGGQQRHDIEYLQCVHGDKSTFSDGVREYLSKFSETGASAVALIGGLPFIRGISPEGLEELLQLLNEDGLGFHWWMSSLMRLAQDVKFDSTEPLNCGVMGYAVKHSRPLVDVTADRLEMPDIEEINQELRKEWEGYSNECSQYIQLRVKAIREQTLKPMLDGFVNNLFGIANKLSGFMPDQANVAGTPQVTRAARMLSQAREMPRRAAVPMSAPVSMPSPRRVERLWLASAAFFEDSTSV